MTDMEIYSVRIGNSLKNVDSFEQMVKVLSLAKSGYVTAIRFGEPNSGMIMQGASKIRKQASDDFMYRSVKFYEYEMPNGIIALSLLGAVRSDLILARGAYMDETILHFADGDNSNIVMLQYDSYRDRVSAIRKILIPKSISQRIVDIYNHNNGLELNQKEYLLAQHQLASQLIPCDFEERAKYIGCEAENIWPEELILGMVG